MEWLERGTYRLSVQNPPLGRIACAIGPYLAGLRLPAALGGVVPSLDAGNAILYANDDYMRNLALARAGNLFWFLAAIALVWGWARMLFGRIAGLAAVAIFTHTPAMLAYAGLATTEMPMVATYGAAVLALTLWLDRPTPRRAAIAGVATAAAILCKLLSVLFLPAALLALAAFRIAALAREERKRWCFAVARQSIIALLAAFVMIWGCYRFSVMPAERLPELLVPEFRAGAALLEGMQSLGVPMPAPELFAGVEVSWAMNYRPQYRSYFLGELSERGWWYYYPVVLAVKVPPALTVLAAIGLFVTVVIHRARRDWKLFAPLLAAASMLLATLAINVNTGIRYVAPLFLLVAIAASAGAARAFEQPPARIRQLVFAVPLALLLVFCTLAHPDYLAYFNFLAGRHPEAIVVDSDLDWGQDLLRLNAEVERRGIRELSLAYFGTARPDAHITSARARPLPPNVRATGWVAASRMVLAGAWGEPGGYAWLSKETPVAEVGKSIVLYRVE
jgi:4-amino-4-deoxy-L-arabinose transferase-like glycosyltransferase